VNPQNIRDVFDDYKICVTFSDNDSVSQGLIKSTTRNCFNFEVIGVNHAPYFKDDFEDVEI